MHTPQQLFALYCDLYELDVQHFPTAVIDAIVQGGYTDLYAYHVYGFVLRYFHRYCRGELSLEDWMQAGDITSDLRPFDYKQQYQPHLHCIQDIIKKIDADASRGQSCVFVLPEIAVRYTQATQPQQREQLQSQMNSRSAQVIW